MFKRKPSNFDSTIIPLGKTQVKFLKPTIPQLEQIVGGKGLFLTPQITKEPTSILDKFEAGIDKFNRILGLMDKFAEPTTKKKPTPKESDLPDSLKDPWGKNTW